MIKFEIVVPDPQLSEDCYVYKTVSWPVLPRVGEMIYLPGCIGRNVEQVRHDFSEDNLLQQAIEVVVGVVEEEFTALYEEFGWEKNGFD